MVEVGPKLMQGLVSGAGDFFLWKIVNFYYGEISWFGVAVVFCNWFYAGMLSRMYANSFETALTIIAFYLWISRKDNQQNDYLSRLIVIVAYVSRPTSILLWALIWPYELFADHTPVFSYKFIKFIAKNVISMYPKHYLDS